MQEKDTAQKPISNEPSKESKNATAQRLKANALAEERTKTQAEIYRIQNNKAARKRHAANKVAKQSRKKNRK